MRLAGVFPRNLHPTTWVAALTVVSVCVAGALYVGEKAAAYLPDRIAITSWQPPAPDARSRRAGADAELEPRQEDRARTVPPA